MMNDELNLGPYRKAWQAEKERLQSAPPQHSEQDILAMLSQHSQKKDVVPQRSQKHRSLPIWLGSAAASVAILIGVAWMLWLRPTATPTVPPTIAELRPHTPSSITQDTPIISTAPDPLTTPPSPYSHARSMQSRQESNKTLPIGAFDTPPLSDDYPFSLDVTNTKAVASGLPDESPSVHNPSSQSQWQSFQQSDVATSINKQKSPKEPLVRTWSDHTSSQFPRTQISFSLGACFPPTTRTRPLVGVGMTMDTKSEGLICANNQGGIYLLFGMPPFSGSSDSLSVILHYGYGLSCRPTDNLAIRLNLGGYLLFGKFDLGLRLNAEAGYRLTEFLTLSAGYQYIMPGIVSGEGRHTAMLSLGYVIN